MLSAASSAATGEAPPVLDVRGLEVSYRDRQVLKGLDLSIEKGAVVGLLGPNGAGKTTLIRTICGRVRPDHGSVSIEGRPNRQRASLNRLGLVPQEIGLYPHLTVRENLEAFARLSGLDAASSREAVDWALDVARLSTRSGDRIAILSGGWKRRANIAAAILHNPALLILDEPTVGVDVDARHDLHELIGQLAREGMGVLIATHDLEQAETICSRVGFLLDGRIELTGSPQELIDAHFGTEAVIVIELRQVPTDAQRAALTRAGFTPSNAAMSWTIYGKADDAVVSNLSVRLDRLGINAREIRHRKPGLDTLFLKLARQSADGAAA